MPGNSTLDQQVAEQRKLRAKLAQRLCEELLAEEHAELEQVRQAKAVAATATERGSGSSTTGSGTKAGSHTKRGYGVAAYVNRLYTLFFIVVKSKVARAVLVWVTVLVAALLLQVLQSFSVEALQSFPVFAGKSYMHSRVGLATTQA